MEYMLIDRDIAAGLDTDISFQLTIYQLAMVSSLH